MLLESHIDYALPCSFIFLAWLRFVLTETLISRPSMCDAQWYWKLFGIADSWCCGTLLLC